VKTKFFTLLLAGLCLCALAQTPPPSAPATNDAKAQDQALRDLLRRSMRGDTNTFVVPPAGLPSPVGAPAPIPTPAPVEAAAPAAPPATDATAPTAQPAAEPGGAAPPGGPTAAQPAGPAEVPPPLNNAATTQPAAPAPAPQPEEMIPTGMINWTGAELNQVLPIYAGLVNRTILRAPNIASPPIVLQAQTPLTKKEAIQVLDAVLALNGIAMINIGDKFVKAVPIAMADSSGAKLDRSAAKDLPDMGQYVTHIIQLKTAKPSELVPILQQFGNTKSILPVDSSQILVIRDYAENVKRMLEMIAEIDVVVPSEFVSEVIPIKYALASDISSALNSLSGTGGGTSVGARSAGGGLSGARTAPGARPGYPAGSIPTPGATPAGTPSSGATFSDRLQAIIRRASTSSASGDLQIIGTTKIVSDERMNALLVFASREDMKMIKDIISKLDVVLAQVLIEAIIMEVSLDDSKSLGVSAAQQPKQLTPDVTGVGGFNNGQKFFSPVGGSNSITFPGNFTSVLPGSAFSYWGKIGPSFDVAVQAAAADSRVNVLSRPRIQTSHGVEANLFIGQTVPYISGTTYGYGTGGSQSQYQEKQIGITLRVKPLINSEGLVVMDISQDIGQRGADVIIDGNPVPIINQRQASATVAVRDRETIILGGFISNTKTKGDSGVPFLKDIPLLGHLFRSTSASQQRVELMVLLRPTVLPTPELAAITAQSERNRLPGIKRAEADFREDEAKRLKTADKIVMPSE
jgi:general secretion pathway protein D